MNLRGLALCSVKAAIRAMPARLRVLAKESPVIAPMIGTDVLLDCQSWTDWQLRRRWAEFEPRTVQWVRDMPAGSILYDVGANVGCCSILAAKRGIKVVAFEPHPVNCGSLVRNIHLNGVKVVVEPSALADWSGMRPFRYASLDSGSALHSLTIDEEHSSETYRVRTLTIDEFVSVDWLPTHIKIDVDGYEEQVILGAMETLRAVQSVMFEGTLKSSPRILSKLGEAGFTEFEPSHDYPETTNWFCFR